MARSAYHSVGIAKIRRRAVVQLVLLDVALLVAAARGAGGWRASTAHLLLLLIICELEPARAPSAPSPACGQLGRALPLLGLPLALCRLQLGLIGPAVGQRLLPSGVAVCAARQQLLWGAGILR